MSTVDDPFGQHSPAPSAGAPAGNAEVADDEFDDELEDDDLEDDDLEDDEDVEDDVAIDDGSAPVVDEVDANQARGLRAAAVVEYIATSFADNPDAIDVETSERGRNDVMIYLHADRGDAGRLIGRRGRVINAIRQVARAAGSLDGERVQLDLAEE